MDKQTNKEYMKNDQFIKDCKKVGIEPTSRQASKYKMKKGKVYKTLNKLF